MKWEAIKRRVAQDICADIERGHAYGSGSGEAMAACLLDAIAERRALIESVRALQERCERIVMAWDVRCVGRLRELFPASFPARLRHGALGADYDEQDDWAIYSI